MQRPGLRDKLYRQLTQERTQDYGQGKPVFILVMFEQPAVIAPGTFKPIQKSISSFCPLICHVSADSRGLVLLVGQLEGYSPSVQRPIFGG